MGSELLTLRGSNDSRWKPSPTMVFSCSPRLPVNVLSAAASRASWVEEEVLSRILASHPDEWDVEGFITRVFCVKLVYWYIDAAALQGVAFDVPALLPFYALSIVREGTWWTRKPRRYPLSPKGCDTEYREKCNPKS